MSNAKTMAAAEAILFSMGKAMPVSDLGEALKLNEEETAQLIDDLHARCEAEESGLTILRLEDKVQLCAKPAYYKDLIRVIKKPKVYELTEILMETLAIVAYRQPVTRLDIERIRGVNCDYAVNQLIEFGLICEKGRLDAPGRPLLFGTTDEFLRHFGISSIEEMPTFGREELDSFRREAAKEAGLEEDEIPEEMPETEVGKQPGEAPGDEGGENEI